MTLKNYLKDKILIILLNSLGVFFLYIYLLIVGNSTVTAGLIVVIWAVVCSMILAVDFIKRRKYFNEINHIMSGLDRPYLIQEFMENSWRLEDKLYRDILYRSNKAVIEQINELKSEQKTYREYLEGWIHEVKLPITGMRLACHDGIDVKRLELYLSEMDHLVEQALFYARSEQVYKDFQIKEIDLKILIADILRKNKYLFIQNDMSVQVLFDKAVICSDEKWITFIIIQILINAVKYKKDTKAGITFSIEESQQSTKLKIKDNGIGILPEELAGIFEKGFTGTNGRDRENTTGIGLYLCRKLCRKLEILIEADSVRGEYTEICLTFPKSSYLSKM